MGEENVQWKVLHSQQLWRKNESLLKGEIDWDDADLDPDEEEWRAQEREPSEEGDDADPGEGEATAEPSED